MNDATGVALTAVNTGLSSISAHLDALVSAAIKLPLATPITNAANIRAIDNPIARHASALLTISPNCLIT
jgi:hypothetical protein